MSKLVWDAAGSRLYETGVDHAILFKASTETGASHFGYGKGVAWSGITSVQESPEGADPNAIYADNIKYLNLIGTEELKGTIGAYMYPDEFAECNGEKSPTSGIVVGQQNRTTFGLIYRTIIGNDAKSNDYGFKLHFLYGCTVSPSDREYQTVNDSPEAIEFSWEFSTVPTSEVPVVSGMNFKPTASVTVDATKFTSSTTDSGYTENFDKLLAFIEGTDGSGSVTGTDSYLPSPKEIYALLANGTEPTV